MGIIKASDLKGAGKKNASQALSEKGLLGKGEKDGEKKKNTTRRNRVVKRKR